MKSSSKLTLMSAALLVLALFASACSSDPEAAGGSTPGPDSGETADGSTSGGSGSSGEAEAAGQGVTLRIEDPGDPSGDTQILINLDNASGQDIDIVERETTLEGDPLDTQSVAQLLNRLPDLEAEEADQVDFNRPPETRPRPRPGSTIDSAFPPPVEATAPETATGPLEVLRFQPEGPVDLAPFISVTFNQPMVALSTVSQVEEADVPISITP